MWISNVNTHSFAILNLYFYGALYNTCKLKVILWQMRWLMLGFQMDLSNVSQMGSDATKKWWKWWMNYWQNTKVLISTIHTRHSHRQKATNGINILYWLPCNISEIIFDVKLCKIWPVALYSLSYKFTATRTINLNRVIH